MSSLASQALDSHSGDKPSTPAGTIINGLATLGPVFAAVCGWRSEDMAEDVQEIVGTIGATIRDVKATLDSKGVPVNARMDHAVNHAVITVLTRDWYENGEIVADWTPSLVDTLLFSGISADAVAQVSDLEPSCSLVTDIKAFATILYDMPIGNPDERLGTITHLADVLYRAADQAVTRLQGSHFGQDYAPAIRREFLEAASGILANSLRHAKQSNDEAISRGERGQNDAALLEMATSSFNNSIRTLIDTIFCMGATSE